MRKLYYLIATTLFVSLFTACKEDTPVTPPEVEVPAIELSQSAVELPADGGVAVLYYAIANAVDGIELTAELPADCWAEVESIAGGMIKLQADRNTTDSERTAQLTLSYEGAESKTVTLSQPAWLAPIKLSVTNVDDLSVTFSVETTDPELTWIPLMTTKEYFDSLLNDDAVFEDDMQYIVQQAIAQEITPSDYISQLLKKGSMDNLRFNKLTPKTTYTLYVYGLTPEGERTTDIISTELTTGDPYDGPIDFNIEVAEQDFVLYIDITPSHDGVSYFWDIIDEQSFNANGGKMPDVATELIEAKIEDYLYYGDITSRSEYYEWFSSINAEQYIYEARANTRYIIYALKWDEDCKIVGDVSYVWHETQSLGASINEITLAVSDALQTSFCVTTTTTTDDPYVVLAEPADWCGWDDMNDEEIFDYVINSYGTYWVEEYVCEGPLTDARFYDLDPDTEYSVIAFGYEAGVRTTDIQRAAIRTLPACDPEDCTFEFDVVWTKSNSAYIAITPSDLSHYYHWMVYDPETTEAEAKTMIKNIIQYDYYADYIEFSYDALRRGESEGTVNLLAPDTEYKVGVVIMDPDRNRFLSDVTFSDTFRTAEMKYADIEVRCVYDEYYDGDVFGASLDYNIYAGNAVVPLRIEISGKYAQYYYTIFTWEDNIDNPEIVPDYQLYEYLYNGVYYAEQMNFRCPWDTDLMLAAVALDKDGYHSPVYRQKVSFSKDGVTQYAGLLNMALFNNVLTGDVVVFEDKPMSAPVVERVAAEAKDVRFSTATLNAIRKDVRIRK